MDKGIFSSPTVLVVEDEPLLRILAVEVVQEAGLPAVEAKDADEALQILEQRSDIGIVFTDVDMPGSMTGLDLAAIVRDRWPPVDLLITSGKVRVEDDDVPVRSVFLQKPYDIGVVVNTLLDFAQRRDV